MTFKYEIEDHGTEHGQYFQGAGVAHTEYKEIVTGVGHSARDAGEDALEQFYTTAITTDVSVADLDTLHQEIEKLPDVDCHEECRKDFDREWETRREWTVTIQRPWDNEPAPVYVEISPGTEHFSPGAVGVHIYTMNDPEEIVKKALDLARERVVDVFFSSAEFGPTEGDEQTPEDLEKWAEEQKEEIEKERDEAFEKAHENCELAHRVSIRWSTEES